MKIEKKIPDSWLCIPILILGIHFFYRLIDQSKLLYIFPLDYTNDISSYMAQLYFLAEIGFHKFVPYWYNGFISFQFVPPGWFFFSLPLYWIFKDILVTTYISMILIFLIGFIAFYFLGKLHNFSIIKRIAFFFLFFGNAIAIGNFIRLGDIHILFAWTNFCILGLIILYYKNKIINNYFYISIIFLSIVILSHQTVAVLSPFLLLSLFLAKKNIKERIKIIIVFIASLFLTSFWWIPYIKGFGKIIASKLILTGTLFSFKGAWLLQNIATFIIPIIFLVIFYYYWKSYKKSKKELLFFLPYIILSLLLFFRIIYFIPFLRYVYPDSYLFLFLFFSIFMLFKIDLNILSSNLKKIIFGGLILICIISVSINILHTPKFIIPGEIEKETLNIFQYIDDKFLIFGGSTTSYSRAYYSYAPIYYNLSTADGWYYTKDESYMNILKDTYSYFKNNDCSSLIKNLKYLKTKYIISYKSSCEKLDKCNFIKKRETEHVCLYYLNN